MEIEERQLTLLMASIIHEDSSDSSDNKSLKKAVDIAEEMKSYYKQEYGQNISMDD